jgi:hypothetical protein
VRQYRAREITGLVQQGDREVRIAAADLSFTPKSNDQVVDGSQTLGEGAGREEVARPAVWIRHPPSVL